MSEIFNPSAVEPEISKSLKFWQSRSPRDQFWSQKSVWLIMVATIAAHTAFWLLLPNPIKRNPNTVNTQKISTIAVVTLPPELLLKSKLRLPQSFTPLNLNQINLPSPPPPPSGYNPSILPPPLLSVLPQDPQQSNLKILPSAGNLQPNLRNNLKGNNQSNLNFPVTSSNIKPEVLGIPNNSPNLIDNTKPIQPEPLPVPMLDPVTRYSYRASDLMIRNTDINSIISQYGADKVIQRQIAAPNVAVSPDQREPMEWIPLDQKSIPNISGSVVFVLVVSPSGRVVKDPIVLESTNSKLEQVALETIKGYYDRFKPLGLDKYRLVRINYRIP
ncbi:Gram-negative bacterial tonB protein [Synechococcus sp. PCC 7502]|uniref:TonB protein n=1 Tax=Synechococcus sp. PCC 7502 TaxID=1173263 RepID=UPI00029F819B|nr:TonB protein [Synechococcus sp. PCC 7502]AFY73812.1 Gram-negative bacterial tonB protein [Synechococcus sp. PCC 7502]